MIPTSPSLLDHVTKVNSWLPYSVVPPRVWSYPSVITTCLLRQGSLNDIHRFPLNSEDYSSRTLKDQVIQAFGVSIPLLRLLSIPSRCSSLDTEPIIDDVGMRRPSLWRDIARDEFGDLESLEIVGDVLKQHPYVITRYSHYIVSVLERLCSYFCSTQIRVVDETHPFELKAYDAKHRLLSRTSVSIFAPITRHH